MKKLIIIIALLAIPSSVWASTYATNYNALTPPNIPSDSLVTAGSILSASDGVNNYLSSANTSVVSEMLIDHELSTSTAVWSYVAEFANTSNPATSYIFPGLEYQTTTHNYGVVLSRGTGESRGALWIQKGFEGGDGILGPNTTVGTSGTTFTGGIKYTVNVGISTQSSNMRTFAVSVQRSSDNNWLKSDGTWTVGVQTALTVSDTSTILSNYGYATLSLFASAANDGKLYSMSFDNEQIYRFQRSTTTPVLAKGGTYDGWKADALADPQVTRSCDNTQYVMQVSLWSIANAKWATAFFTSPHLKANTWVYLSGSLWAPSGSDYILGNGGIVCFKNAYYFTYSHYPSNGVGVAIAIASSSDLLTWHNIADPLVPTFSSDAANDINPQTGKLEVWFIEGASFSSRTTHMWDTSDGNNWTDEGDFGVYHIPNLDADYGEPAVFYIGKTRYLSIDGGPANGYRNMLLYYSPNQDTNWTFVGMSLSPWPANFWESSQLFDDDVIVTDDGDGLGLIPHDVYAGSDTNSSTDNTDSSIGVTDLLVWPSGSLSMHANVFIRAGARVFIRSGKIVIQ